MRRLLPAAIFLAAVTVTPAVFSQTAATAAIVGEVVDATGGVVAGAAITAADQSTGQSRSARTNQAGQYTLTGLAPGAYKITASANGFRQAVVARFDVEVAKSYNVN